MTRKQILKKAIEKAEKNKWHFPTDFLYAWRSEKEYVNTASLAPIFNWMIETGFYKCLLFDHVFAKALWYCNHEVEKVAGTHMKHCKKCGETKMIGGQFNDWRYHLKQLVLLNDDEKFKYLEGFVDNGETETINEKTK